MYIQPTLFIGLGGSGCKVVTQIQRQMRNNPRLTWFKDFVYFKKIDTRPSPDVGVTEEDYYALATPLMTGADMVADLLSDNTTESVRSFTRSWWRHQGEQPEKPNHEFSLGAGMIRRYGRLSFAWNNYTSAKDIKRALIDIQNDLNQKTPPPGMSRLQIAQLDVVVFCGTSGGTGSGILCDVGHLVRSILKPHAMSAVLFTDAVVSENEPALNESQKKLMRKNMLHTLSEFEYWQIPKVQAEGKVKYKAAWNEVSPEIISYDTGLPPFEIALVVSTQNDQLYKLSKADSYYSLGGLFFGSLYGSDEFSHIWSQFINDTLDLRTAVEHKGVKPSHESHRYGRFGFLEIHIPRREIIEFLVNTMTAEALERGFQHRKSRDGKAVERAVEETWSTELGMPTFTSASLLEKEGEPVDCARRIDFEEIRWLKNYPEFYGYFSNKDSELFDYYSACRHDRASLERIAKTREYVDQRVDAFSGKDTEEIISVANTWHYCKSLGDRVIASLANCVARIKQLDEQIKKWREEQKAYWGQWEESFKSRIAIFKRPEARGVAAKDSAKARFDEYSELLFQRRHAGAEYAILKRMEDVLKVYAEVTGRLRDEARRLQSACEEDAEGAMNIPHESGIYIPLIKSREDLVRQRPQWFEKDAKRKWTAAMYRSLISGKYPNELQEVKVETDTGGSVSPKGVAAYIKKMCEVIGPNNEQATHNLLAAFGREMKAMARQHVIKATAPGKEVERMTVWGVICKDAARASLSSGGVAKKDQEQSFEQRLAGVFASYAERAMPFSRIHAGRVPRTQVYHKYYIISDDKSACEAIKREGAMDDDGALSLYKRVVESEQHQRISKMAPVDKMVIFALEYGFPIDAFVGLEQVREVLQSHESSESWSDVRYPEWIEKAFGDDSDFWHSVHIGLAFAWRDGKGPKGRSSGLTWNADGTKRFPAKERFTFEDGSEFEGSTSLFAKLAQNEIVYATLKKNLAMCWDVGSDEQRAALKAARDALVMESIRNVGGDNKRVRQDKYKETADNISRLIQTDVLDINCPNP